MTALPVDSEENVMKPVSCVMLIAVAAAACLASCTDFGTKSVDPPGDTTATPDADAGEDDTTTADATIATDVPLDGDLATDVDTAPDLDDTSDTSDTSDDTSTPDTTDADTSTADATDTTEPDPCEAIAPSTDPQVNLDTILGCLQDGGTARLTDGIFPIANTIDMPDGSRLLGNTTWPRVVLQGGAQAVVRTHDDNEVAFVRLDANHNLTVPHGGVVMTRGSRAFVHDNHIQNADGPTGDSHATGVRFSHTDGRDNRVFRNQIHHLHYGVIFDIFPHGARNVLEGNTITQIRCDGVTFRGFGVAIGNDIHHAGWQCLNPPESPIPGGGFYTLNNDQGAEIIDNHAYEVCGMPLDLDRASNLLITGNTFEKPGWTGQGNSHCGAGVTAHLLDISESTITGNTFRKDGAHVLGRDPNRVFSASGGATDAGDLPAGTNTAVAFALTHRREETTWSATHNTIEDNRFIANCTAPCLGLGWFAGRGTGYTPAGQWSAATTNYFRRNSPVGSNYGSKRCGGNWYAADDTCPGGADCNADDDQHQGSGHNWSRNDNCEQY